MRPQPSPQRVTSNRGRERESFAPWRRADPQDRICQAAASLLTLVLLVTLIPPASGEGPVTTLLLGSPSYLGPTVYVSSATPLSFSPLDLSGAGIRNTTYRVDGGPWINYTATGSFTLTGEGEHRLEWFSEDLAGNVEPVANATVRVDDTPPQTTLVPTAGPFGTDTLFTLAATDTGSGVARTEYRVNGGAWEPYVDGFRLSPGEHVVGHRSIDRVENQEPERVFSVTITTMQEDWSVGLLIASTLATVIFAAALAFFEFLRRSFLLPFVILWAKLTHRAVVDQKNRWLLRGYLMANPGANFEAIRADLKMAVGTLGYHLYVLEKEGILRSWRDGRFRRYAPAGHRIADLKPKVVDRLTDLELILLERIRQSPSVSQRDLARDMGISQPAIHYHLSKMVEMGTVRMERRGIRARYFATCDPERPLPDRGTAD